ncbi:MAG: class IV adenylate cyclase [Chloroflexi bacterium]|nr:class IV adenylate cyclase [Chloroflexota bacterium]
MNDKLQEVEVKLHTPDLEAVKRALEAAGATLDKPRVFERNVRYDSADGSLTAAGIVLRLRQDEAVKLTYKADASVERGIVSRFEAEVEVSDLEMMDVILRRLGYAVALVYQKFRTTYTLDGAEIVLDELPFGSFTEIESDAATIERVAGRLGLAGARRMTGSYVDIFADVKARLGLDVRDCTFEDFAVVNVNGIAFD